MDTLNFEVLTRLAHRWDTVQQLADDALTSPAETEALRRFIAIFKLMAQSGDAFVPERAAALATWLWANGESYGVALAAMFQIRRTVRPILMREYPGVEGFLNGEMHFEAITNHLLTLVSDAYSAAVLASK